MRINEEAVTVVQNGAVPMERERAVQIVHNLTVDGLLVPAPQIISTAAELAGIDGRTVLIDRHGSIATGNELRLDLAIGEDCLPAITIASGEMVRSRRGKLEGIEK